MTLVTHVIYSSQKVIYLSHRGLTVNSKSRVVLMAAVAVVVLLLGVSFAVSTWRGGNTAGALWILVGAIGITLVAVQRLKVYYVSTVQGLPAEDERSRKVMMYSAGYAYHVSLYVWLALMYVRDYLTQSQIFVVGMLGMVLSFGVAWLFLNRKESI
jgi:hypothetical protein